MFSKVATVQAVADRTLLVWFKGGETRLYDVSQLFERWPQFRALESPELLSSVRVDAGGYGISWNDGLDLSADELLANGTPAPDLDGQEARVVAEFSSARKAQGVTQRALEEASGVRQPVIARMENGGAVPRLDTILRVLAPLGKTLKVVDIEFDGGTTGASGSGCDTGSDVPAPTG